MGDKKRKADAVAKSKPIKRQRSALVEVNRKNSEGISECFHRVSVHLYLSLAPVHTAEPELGIKIQHLDPLLMTYFAPAGGVVLGHDNLQLNGMDPEGSGSKVAKLMYDSPFAYLWVQVDLLIWKPIPGDVLEGWINFQSPSHIGLLIHDTFNATIKRDSIPTGWTFVPDESNEEEMEEESQESGKFHSPKSIGFWQDANGERVDGKISFTVKSFNVSGRTVSVQGSLLKPGEIKDLTKFENKEYELPAEQSVNQIKVSPEPEGTAEVLTYDDESSDSESESD